MSRGLLRAVLLLVAAVIAVSSAVGAAATDPSIVVFYEEHCPDCEAMDAVLDELLAEHPGLVITHLEIGQPGNLELMTQLLEAYDVDLDVVSLGVPTLFIGDAAFVRARSEDESAVRDAVQECVTHGCRSPLPSPSRGRGDVVVLVAFALLFAALYLVQGR